MRDTKRRLELYSFFNHTGIAAHLEDMAQKGWMIEKITGFGWVYRRIEPKRLHFSVSYYARASEFDPQPSEGQREFQEFCEHTGWKLACSSAQLQIFYNDQPDPTPIETDPKLELEAIHASAKKGFLLPYFLLLAVAVVQGGVSVGSFRLDPVGMLASNSWLFGIFGWTMLLLICSVELGVYFVWRARAKKAAEQGEFLKVPSTTRFQQAVFVLLVVCSLVWLAELIVRGSGLERWAGGALLVGVVLMIFLVNGLKQYLKRRRASRGLNRTLTLTFAFVLTVFLFGAVTAATLWAASNDLIEIWDSKTPPPLTMRDLQPEQQGDCRVSRRNSASLLLERLDVVQMPEFDSDEQMELGWMEYHRVLVKAPFLYEFCKKQMISEMEERRVGEDAACLPMEPSLWEAVQAYRVHDPELGPENHYLLCYDGVLVEIVLTWEPTEEQMKTVAQKLGVGG